MINENAMSLGNNRNMLRKLFICAIHIIIALFSSALPWKHLTLVIGFFFLDFLSSFFLNDTSLSPDWLFLKISQIGGIQEKWGEVELVNSRGFYYSQIVQICWIIFMKSFSGTNQT